MTSPSDSQLETRLRRQRRDMYLTLSALALGLTLVCWYLPGFALAMLIWVALSAITFGLYLTAFTIGHWWASRH